MFLNVRYSILFSVLFDHVSEISVSCRHVIVFVCCFASPLMQHVQGPSEFNIILLDVSFVSVKTMCPAELFDCPLNSKIHSQAIWNL